MESLMIITVTIHPPTTVRFLFTPFYKPLPQEVWLLVIVVRVGERCIDDCLHL